MRGERVGDPVTRSVQERSGETDKKGDSTVREHTSEVCLEETVREPKQTSTIPKKNTIASLKETNGSAAVALGVSRGDSQRTYKRV